MRAIIKYDLNNEEDAYQYRLSNKAHTMFTVLEEIEQYCRSQCKHGDITEETYDHLDKVRSMIWDQLNMSDMNEY